MSGQLPVISPLLAAELARQYDVLQALGRGGMGVVWLARERSLDRLVAIKVLAGDAIESADLRERFRREARIAARLVHPHIVPLHAFGETPDALYFVMGYVEGETLAGRLERETRLDRQAAHRILAEIADALAFAHREGVVHRDVKPENILLDRKSGRAMLADFGVARIENGATSVTLTGMAVGTPSYMSPEQALGTKEIDGRSDIYALGVVGYRMLMGRLPFTGGTVQALMAQHAAARPDDLALAVAPAERGLAQVIMRALEKDPEARWARAEDLRVELDAAARGGAVLPEELERLDMVGTKSLLATAAIGGIFAIGSLWNPRWFSMPEARMIILANLSIFPLISAAMAYPAGRKFGWRDTLRALLHPPATWAHWWPRALRRANDIWDRLPGALRRIRNITDGVVAWLVLDLAFLTYIGTTGGGALGDALLAMRGPWDDLLWVGPKLLVASWVTAEFIRARRRLGVNTRDLWELLGLPHLANAPGWEKPKFARLLAPEATPLPQTGTPQTPAELESAIARLTHRLRNAGLLPDEESAQAARAVRAAIEALEAEVQRLHQDVDPAERERLDRRLAALGPGEDDAELRTLLESQRAVLQRLEQRRREKEARRDRLREQLATLWMQLVDLDARAGRGATVDPALTGQVRALSAELSRVGEAVSEVERLLKPAEPHVPSTSGA